MDKIWECLDTYPSNWALGSAALCAAGSIEMALRIFKDMKDGHLDNLSKDLAGALFYGLCAANLAPHTALLGAAIFTVRTIATYGRDDVYLTMKIYGNILKTAWEWTITPLCEHIVIPLAEHAWNHLISPLAQTISKCFATIFRVVKLPENPAWYGVAALIVTIITYRFFPFTFQCPIRWTTK